jgi:dTDP-4-dehydrorhamnose reductase
VDYQRVSRWLVTGAAGQLGQSVLALAAEYEIEASAYPRAELDIGDAAAVARSIEETCPDVVLNCAAYTKVDLCEAQPDEAARANELGPRLLAEACKAGPLLVHMSTDYIFDGETSRPLLEDAPANPLGVYGRSKLGGEEAVRASGADYLIVRSQWLFGPGPNFVRMIVDRAAEGRELRVVEDQVGRPTWTRPLAAAIFQAVKRGARQELHLACDGVASWYDLAREAVLGAAKRGLCPEVPVRPIPSREMPRPAARPAYAVLGLERARELGIGLPHWREALSDYLDREAARDHA